MSVSQLTAPGTPARGEWASHGDSVCAVMVTYHPTAGMIEHLSNILPQVHKLVIVDNGSTAQELSSLKIAGSTLGVHLIANEVNVGIAEALNQGVRWAKQQGYAWVFLLDQDSILRGGFIEAMLQTWAAHPHRSEVACIHPRYMHPVLGYTRMAPRARDGELVWCITSGALMPTWIFDKIGWFPSEFFIDWVDIEYCFRVRAAGYRIIEAREAVLLHTPGHSAQSSLLGIRFWASHHSAARRYYMSRNRVVVFRKYFFTFPLWVVKAMAAAFRDTLKCFLGERDRPRKFRYLLLGTWDGLTGRMGVREGL